MGYNQSGGSTLSNVVDAGVMTLAPNANSATDSIAIGNGATIGVGSSGGISIGESYADGVKGIAIGVGNNTNAYGSRSSLSIAIGNVSKAHAIYSIAIGRSCSSIVSKGSVIGYNNQSSGNAACVMGGRDNAASNGSSAILGGHQSITSDLNSYSLASAAGIASGNYSGVSGNNPKAPLYGQLSHAVVAFTTGGDSQATELLLSNQTTNATQAELYLDGIAAKAVLPANRTWAFIAVIAARQSGGTAGVAGDSAAWEIKGCIKRDNANNTRLVGVPIVTSLGADVAAAAWAIAATADDVNESLRLAFTGELNKNINITAAIRLAECGG